MARLIHLAAAVAKQPTKQHTEANMSKNDSKRPSITEKSLSRRSSKAGSIASTRSRNSVSSSVTSIASAAPSFLSKYSFSSRRSSCASGARDLIYLDPVEQNKGSGNAVDRVYQWEKVLADPNIEPVTVPYTRTKNLQIRLVQEADLEAYATYARDGISSMSKDNTLSSSADLAMTGKRFMLDFDVIRKSRPSIKCSVRLSHCSLNDNCAAYLNGVLQKCQLKIRKGGKITLPDGIILDVGVFPIGLAERRASSAFINTLQSLENEQTRVSKAFVISIYMPQSASTNDDMETFARANWNITVGVPKKTPADFLVTLDIPWSVLDVSQAFPARLYKATEQQRKDWFGPQKQTGSRRHIVLKVTDIKRDTTKAGTVLSAKLVRQAGPGISVYASPAAVDTGRSSPRQPAHRKAKGGWLGL